MSKKILTIVGTRPNFIKVTQFNKWLNKPQNGWNHKIVHTGQHYDDKMSKVFFQQFNLTPDIWLNIAPGSPNTQIATIMLKLETVIKEEKPDLMIVVGDVNSTFAAAVTAHKCGIPLAHLESGLRSRDMGMPEENNRIITDAITKYFFVTEQSGWDNLIAEGKKEADLFFVGNTMIDTLVAFEPEIDASKILEAHQLTSDKYALMTMHRPATVDNKEGLEKLLEIIRTICRNTTLVFPIHPRTRKRFEEHGLAAELNQVKQLLLLGPLDYFSFQKLIKESKFVITDSGGIQEETTFRKTPCLTLRPNTERPSTIEIGSNTLVTFDIKVIQNYIQQIENGQYKKGMVPPKWDGQATKRIAEVILKEIIKPTSNLISA